MSILLKDKAIKDAFVFFALSFIEIWRGWPHWVNKM